MPAVEDRIRILTEAAPNSWIALSEDESKVVGRGSTYEEAVQNAADNGTTDPVLIMTPSDWTPMVLAACE